ncbi:MAG: secondary thiamine-phosphate synthase enzyme YjbQ [Thermodesulfovibrionales bacterium]
MVRYINVRSRHRAEFIDITADIEKELAEAGANSGVCYIYVPHTTAAVTINEGADPSVQRDILNTLARLAPRDEGYLHREGNADAHVKSTLVGVSQYVLVEDGKLILGTWQAVYFCEFDGPRHRRVALRFIPNK